MKKWLVICLALPILAIGLPSSISAATVRGQLLDAFTGEPVGAASSGVLLVGPNPGEMSGALLDDQRRFVFNWVQPGTYRLWAHANGYTGQCWGDPAVTEQQCLYEGGGTPITIGPSSDFTANFNLLSPRGRISGTVKRRADNSPVANAQVLLHNGFSFYTSARTDANGVYRTAPLPSGYVYRLVVASVDGLFGVTYPSFVCSNPSNTEHYACPQGEVVRVADGTIATGIDFLLDPGGSIRGHVRRIGGSPPAPTPMVRAYDRMGVEVANTWGDSEDDSFQFDLLPPGRYTLQAGGRIYPDLPCTQEECDVRFGQPIYVSAGATVEGIEFAYSNYSDVEIGVWDALTGALVPGFPSGYVELIDARTGGRTEGRLSGSWWYFPSVYPGEYFVRASGHGYIPEGLAGVHLTGSGLDEVAKSGKFVVTATSTERPAIFLDRAARVTGRVVLPGGAPASSCRIFTVGADGLPNPHFSRCDAAGNFDLFLLPGATRLLFARANSGTGVWSDGRACAINVDYEPSIGCDLAQAPILQLTGGGEVDLGTLELPVEGGLSGRVVATDGEGVVTVYDLQGRPLASKFVRTGSTPGAGNYHFNALLPGSYQVLFSGESWLGDEVFPELPCHPAACDPGRGQVVVVPPGATVDGIDFTPPPALVHACQFVPCLTNQRFRVSARWTDPQGQQGDAVRHWTPGSRDTAYFWFFSENNTELLVKVLNACHAPYDRFWVFAAGTTNVGVDIEVEDSVTGEVRRYRHQGGPAFVPVLDTDAFLCSDGPPPSPEPAPVETNLSSVAADQVLPAISAAVAPPASTTFCDPEAEDKAHLCLLQGRFRVDATWRSFDGSEGRGIASRGFEGSLWFFAPANVEVMMKVLDGCALNGHYWVFGTGLTNVGVRLMVTDTHTDRQRLFENALGNPFAPIIDTQAFTCWRD